MHAPTYILGTGLSHNGSAVLLKDGKICVAIEKERITRHKHDGGNDNAAINYCLESEGITLKDVALVVQCANFERPDRNRYHGERLFANSGHPPLVDISHHLAHAYSAAGTCHFDEAVILVIDGCGSPFEQCIDTNRGEIRPADIENSISEGMWCEKDSFYHFDGKRVTSLFKDFSPMAGSSEPVARLQDTNNALRMQTTQHSIGGFYAAVSHYVFGNLDDVGKLMGLAPYGKPNRFSETAFRFEEGRLFVRDEWKNTFTKPSIGFECFKADFQYYADVAFWAQEQVEQAVRTCFEERLKLFPHTNVCYSGGVALNAVANAKLLNEDVMQNLYMEPAAGDNGLALGCAFYGWLEVLGKDRVLHDGNTCFGRTYSNQEIAKALENAGLTSEQLSASEVSERTATYLAEGKTIGWFQSGAEFGPRALGHRSILAHPGIPGLGDHINANIKFREDFRPFAPAVLPEFAETCFVSGRKSPYMILVDQTKPEWRDRLINVTHVNGSARVQTIDPTWNKEFHDLVSTFHAKTGIPVVLNTSFNKKGMPIVEHPSEAITLFQESALDVLVLGDWMMIK